MPKFGAQIDTQRIPVKGLIPESSGTAPSSPVTGQLWNDTVANATKRWNGTVWEPFGIAGSGGPPSGAAAGDLTGSYPNPTIGAGKVTSSHILDGTIVDGDIAAANKDGLAATPSMRTLGSGATQAASGADARLSDSRAPNGSAGGDLTGSYPNPTIGAGKVTSSHILDGTIVDGDIAAANKDGANATPGMRSLGDGAGQAMPGVWTIGEIAFSNFNNAAVWINNFKITGVASPTVGTDAANKDYVDSMAQGIPSKTSVRLASTTNLTLTGAATIDGVAVVTGNRVLAKNQTTSSQNGIYIANTTGAWTRALDFDADEDVLDGAFVFVEEGAQGDSGWILSTDGPVVVGTTALAFTQFSGAGQITSGAGMTKTGNTLDVVGTANRITANADSIDIAATYVGQTSITTLGTITSGTWNATTIAVARGGTGATDAATARTNLVAAGAYGATYAPALTAGSWSASLAHGLNSLLVDLTFTEIASGENVILDWKVIDAANVQIRSDLAYAVNTLRCHITAK